MKDNILNEVNEIRKMMGLISEEENVDACDRVYNAEDIEPNEEMYFEPLTPEEEKLVNDGEVSEQRKSKPYKYKKIKRNHCKSAPLLLRLKSKWHGRNKSSKSRRVRY